MIKSPLFGLAILKQPTNRTTAKSHAQAKSNNFGIPVLSPSQYKNPKPLPFPQQEPKKWYNTLDGQVALQGGTAVLHGLASGIAQHATNKGLDASAKGHEYQRDVALINAEIAKMQIEGAYQSGAYEAMVQGLADRQKMSQEVVRQASSGTKIGQGSNADISTTQWINAQINQRVIQKNTTKAINQARMEQANANAQAILEQANADAKRAMKGNVFLSGLLGTVQAVGYSMLAYRMNDMRSPIEQKFFS